MDEKRLVEVQKKKKQLESDQKEVSKLEGEQNSLLKRLKQEFGINSLEDVKNFISKTNTKIDELEKVFEQKMKELDESYEWK